MLLAWLERAWNSSGGAALSAEKRVTGTKAGTKIAENEKAHRGGGLKSLFHMVGPHGLEPWTKGL